MEALPCPVVPVSWGELIDKLTILEIKRERIGGAGARANVEREYALLHGAASAALGRPEVSRLARALKAVNERLWDIEDAIRRKEAEADFGPGFVELARSVYLQNDERASLKRKINEALDSALVEEKSYADYSAARPIFFRRPLGLAG
jgi:hypothetical protein